ncbi:jacalin-related lectin 20-like [Ipomoea triloba]|uniref:jacalin-related lectin 20-like n=1 Tax=Ipomoea triloba TaxID=35885 RepID=UPI00125DF8EB|nr:jacalin-related lectin 20-like [Ipomoea triloba]
MTLKVELMPEGSGEKWDEHSLGQVEGIMVYHDSSFVNSLGFFCVKDNINLISEQHGYSVGKCEMIMLDYPTELLTGLYGFYDNPSCTHIRCITFVTNKATYGPFGGQSPRSPEKAFSFQLRGKERNWITGFYGTIVHNGKLGRLGVYIQKSIIARPLGKLDGDEV